MLLMTLSYLKQIEALDLQLSRTEDPLGKARIYLQAAQLFSESKEIDEACFFMTQALVFAAQHGDRSIEQQARQFLKKNGRI